MMGCLGIELL